MNAPVYIDRHGVKVGSAQGRLTLRTPDGEEQSLPLHQIDQVVVLGHAHFSHDAIAALLREEIPVLFSSLRGGFRGSLSGRSGRQISRRQHQLDSMRNPDLKIMVARALIQAKLRGQGRLLRQWKIGVRHEIADALIASHRCQDIDTLRGYEGLAAKAFFDGLREHLEGSDFRFEKRIQHPSPDPVNALLSLSYTLLLNETEVGAMAVGLDVAGGFYHASADGRPTLLMDLIEPLRPLAERFSARLLRGDLVPGDFEIEGDSCHLRDGRRGVVYKAWGKLLSGKAHWRGEETTWRRLIHLQARELARWLDSQSGIPRFWHLDDA